MDALTSSPAPQDPTERCTGDAGASLVEYALLLALIVVVCIGAVTFLGNNLDNNYSRSTSIAVRATEQEQTVLVAGPGGGGTSSVPPPCVRARVPGIVVARDPPATPRE